MRARGADSNRLVAVTDTLSATSPKGESFTTVRTTADRKREALRGIAFAPHN
ncbi:hypothetical protein AB0L63_31960 [Nocardia sp. NPDC051990]|uniref:hypothetical protein n=1 Tax=Nocardia sp. NPDC051990 TaxID=3155285 RepID=UPI00343EAC43